MTDLICLIWALGFLALALAVGCVLLDLFIILPHGRKEADE